jgi:hypothetical protein
MMASRYNWHMKNTQALTIRVPTEVYEALRSLSFATDTSMNELALRAFGDYLAGQGHQEAVEALAKNLSQQYQVALDKLAHL